MSHEPGAEVLPVSSGQRRLWFLDQIENGGTAWNTQAVFRLRGPLDPAVLERCLGELLERNEALRTTFEPGEDGEPVQVIWPCVEYRLPVVDLPQAGDADDAAGAAAQWAERSRAQPFDIAKGPLFRAALLRLGAAEHHLVLDVHHLVADAWSLRVIYRDLCTLYAARSRGQEGPALPELPIQYGDFAVWERDQLAGADLERSLASWRERLSGAPAPAVFPTDRPQGTEGPVSGETIVTSLPPALVAGARTLADDNGVSLFMVLLAAFDVLLLRLGGQEDLVVGSAVTGRIHADVEDLIGCFVNPIVLRTDLSGSPSFREVLGRVRATVLQAFDHQRMPFDRLVEELKPARSTAKQPFFQTVFQLTDITLDPVRIGDLAIDLAGLFSEAPGVDLAVSIVEQGGGLLAVWEYSPGLFERSTIERMQRHFQTLLASAMAEPDAGIRALRIMSEEEERRLLPEPAETGAAPLLHRLVEQQARSAPAAVALAGHAGRVTYRELNERANRLARALQAQGAGPETIIGVCLPRCPDLPAVVLAILKAGGGYLPLDLSYPAERLAFMVADSGAALVVGYQPPPGTSLASRALSLAQLEEVGSAMSAENLPGPDHPEGTAYVIYTSGSTGKPKGVQVPHRGLANVARVQRELFQLTADDRVGQFFSPSFDASVFEITMAFGAGAALVTASAEDVLPGARLAGTFRDNAVTAVTMTPSALLALGDAEIPSLRLVSAAGEACPVLALQPWLAQSRCFNLYGPTEATIWATSQEADPGPERPGTMLPIGQAIPGVRAYVLDESLNLVPELVTGELCIGGIGVARGYLGRAGLTAERFVPDPFSAVPGSRMYRTGDLVRREPGGALEFIGRADGQVKIRGHRVELGEVEKVVNGCPGVRQCAAVAEPAAAGAGRLICHVVPTPAAGPGMAEEIRAFAAARVPAYVVPDAIVLRDDLPLLPSGKVDRAALLAGDPQAGADDIAYAAPESPMEEFLAGLWQEMLKVPRVGRNDDFFALGGHSLAATLVVTRLKADLGLEVPVTLLFEHRVLADYTRALLDIAAESDTGLLAAP